MSKRTPAPAPAAREADLLRSALRDVTPLADHGRVARSQPRPQPLPLQRWRDERRVLAESLEAPGIEDWPETGEELVFLRPGLNVQTLRKLRRGHWVIQGELDLHGATVAEARELLADFLAACLRGGLRCVRVIHGKGLRSRNRQPVLRQKVAGWLMQREEILAYCQARPTEGGSGAVVVLLKSSG